MNLESKYLELLPSFLRKEGSGLSPELLSKFLLAFERVLTGLDGDEEYPLATSQILDRIADYFDPDKTPPGFLKWLGSWVDLAVEEGDDWNRDLSLLGENLESGDVGKLEYYEEPDNECKSQGKGAQYIPLKDSLNTRNRNMIKNVSKLYRKRGTREGLEEYLRIYAGLDVNDVDSNIVSIREFHEPMQVAYTSTVGHNTIVGKRSYYFQVEVYAPAPAEGIAQEYRTAISTIVDREKPAQTYYDMIIHVPSLRIGYESTIGINTLLGGIIKSE